jgi:hypothetical protein
LVATWLLASIVPQLLAQYQRAHQRSQLTTMRRGRPTARRPDWSALALHWNTTLLNEDNSASAALVHAKSAAHLEHYYD